jgi:tetratricopeptide (TPR) repeat protein
MVMSSTQEAASLTGASLLAQVEERKSRGNAVFSKALYDAAMQFYLSAIWLLKPPARPMYPEALSGQVPPSGSDAVALLGGWRGSETGDATKELALRLSLHLNVAACALKRNDHGLACEACRQVLERGPNAKAHFRLAQALDAQGDTRGAIRELTALLRMEGEANHREGRKMLADLKARDAAERELYKGMGSRKEGFGSSDRPSTAPPPDPNRKEEDPAITRIRQMFGSGAMGPPPSARRNDSDDSDDSDHHDDGDEEQEEEREGRGGRVGEPESPTTPETSVGINKWVRRFLTVFSVLAMVFAVGVAVMVEGNK